MHKELVYIKGFAKGRRLYNTLKAVEFATKLHQGQKRKTGEDYIEHPMRVCHHLMSFNIDDTVLNLDVLFASALLHDVIEDCDVRYEQLKEIFGVQIANIVCLLSKNSFTSCDIYIIII